MDDGYKYKQSLSLPNISIKASFFSWSLLDVDVVTIATIGEFNGYKTKFVKAHSVRRKGERRKVYQGSQQRKSSKKDDIRNE